MKKYIYLLLFSVLLMWCGSINNIKDLQSNNQNMNINKPLISSLSILSNELYVKDLLDMKSFYIDVVWFDVISESGNIVNLWNKEWKTVLTLIGSPSYSNFTQTGAGLYHIAYVHKDRSDLANRLLNMLQKAPQSFGWSADHNVSEAFYFTDPEWNGIEIYYDKDPNTRTRSGGMVKMWSEYLDPNTYIQQHSWTGSQEFHIWHNHLQVWDIEQARQFYHDVLWFEVTADMSGRWALFVSANNYHHHFGLNVWNSNGAWPRPANQLGLGKMYINISNTDEFVALQNRIQKTGIKFDNKDGQMIINDPWNNTLVFTNI